MASIKVSSPLTLNACLESSLVCVINNQISSLIKKKLKMFSLESFQVHVSFFFFLQNQKKKNQSKVSLKIFMIFFSVL